MSFAVYQTFKRTDRLLSSIVLLQTIGIALIILGVAKLQLLAFYAFSQLGPATFYAIQRAKGFKRIVLLLAIVPLLLMYLFKAFHLAGMGLLGYSSLLSLTAVGYAGIKHMKFKNEIGFLCVIGIESLLRIFDIIATKVKQSSNHQHLLALMCNSNEKNNLTRKTDLYFEKLFFNLNETKRKLSELSAFFFFVNENKKTISK